MLGLEWRRNSGTAFPSRTWGSITRATVPSVVTHSRKEMQMTCNAARRWLTRCLDAVPTVSERSNTLSAMVHNGGNV
jgi:hypothetical protein